MTSDKDGAFSDPDISIHHRRFFDTLHARVVREDFVQAVVLHGWLAGNSILMSVVAVLSCRPRSMRGRGSRLNRYTRVQWKAEGRTLCLRLNSQGFHEEGLSVLTAVVTRVLPGGSGCSTAFLDPFPPYLSLDMGRATLSSSHRASSPSERVTHHLRPRSLLSVQSRALQAVRNCARTTL